MAQVRDLTACTLADRWREVEAGPREVLGVETLRLDGRLVEELLVTGLVAHLELGGTNVSWAGDGQMVRAVPGLCPWRAAWARGAWCRPDLPTWPSGRGAGGGAQRRRRRGGPWSPGHGVCETGAWRGPPGGWLLGYAYPTARPRLLHPPLCLTCPGTAQRLTGRRRKWYAFFVIH